MASFAVLAGAMLAFVTPLAHAGKQTAAPAQHPGNFKVPSMVEALRLSDFAAMEPRPELKDKLLHITGFIQNPPRDGQPPPEDRCLARLYQINPLLCLYLPRRQPGQIRGHLARRENSRQTTTYRCCSTLSGSPPGVLFTVNPAGVQADAAWSESNPDYSYDQVWDSEGRITNDGWMAMMAIPFRSLRFRRRLRLGHGLLRNFPATARRTFGRASQPMSPAC